MGGLREALALPPSTRAISRTEWNRADTHHREAIRIMKEAERGQRGLAVALHFIEATKLECDGVVESQTGAAAEAASVQLALLDTWLRAGDDIIGKSPSRARC
jgi:hypothetical protein